MKALHDSGSGLILSVFDSLTIPVFIVGTDRKIISLNSAAGEMFQYLPDDITGTGISELISANPEFERAISSHANAFPSGRKDRSDSSGNRFESVCKKKNGDMFVAMVSVIPEHKDNHSVIVIQDISDQKKLRQKASQRTKELLIFNMFAGILTMHTDTESIMNETIGMLVSHMEADAGWIYLIDDETGDLCLSAQNNVKDDCFDGDKRIPSGKPFSDKVFSSGKPLLVKNSSEDPRVSCRDGRTESMAGVPISSRGNTLGVLGISNRKASYFTSMDIQLLKTVGSQLGVAIENTKLIGQLQDKMRQIKLINELSGIINSSLSIGTIFRIMVSEIKKLVEYDRASLLLFDDKDNNLLIFALDTDLKTILKKGVRAPIEGTSAGWVIKNNQAWINYDLKTEMRFPIDRKLSAEGIRSTISIPLIQDKILGVFNLDSIEPYKYSEKDLMTLLPVAKHISIALENALLFEEISREKKEWEKTFDAITDMVWIEDGRQRVIRANNALLTKTGFTIFEVTDKICCDLLDRIGIISDECLCSDTICTNKPSFRELKGAGGSIFHFWAYPLIDGEGQLYAVVHYLKDVTAQKRLEQQLLRTDKLASLGTLVAGIAHEINNPLGIIAGYSEALIERAEDRKLLETKEFEDFPEYLKTIHNEIFRCKRILKSLLEFSRPSGGTFREIDVNELIKEVILLVNHRAKRLNHNIELRLNRDLPKIYADAGSLRQLFMNIIINSMYFTPEKGSITISSEMNHNKENNTGDDTDMIRVSISDTGAGIQTGMLDKIFDPFFTTKPVGDGTGLGLAICHRIVEEHNGSIDVESEPGSGTTFIIKLPTRDSNDQSARS